MVNLAKSGVSFRPNLNSDQRQRLVDIMGMKQVVSHQKYLGLPTVVGRQKKEVFGGTSGSSEKNDNTLEESDTFSGS
ncbi:unnamed protein product [Linum trigynum]|uniref:Uncharacterized protein n=1 Tax=Linum trigynum TaxID=586398 RepID=A0AAV2E422_9ROSI